MRGRFAFALTALTLLFLLQGLTVLLATAYASVSAVLFSAASPVTLLPNALFLLALLAPALPLAHWTDRRAAIAGTAILTALLRVPMSLPQHEPRVVLSAMVVAAGALFLSLAAGFLERRSIAGGMGAAIVLDQLLRLAGWSWDLSLRPWWVYPQIALAVLVTAMAIGWLRAPMTGAADARPSFERRAGGLRLRGGLSLALILFLDLNVLARPEVATRWMGVPYEAAAVLLIAAGAAATLLLLAGHGPIGRHRPAAFALTVTIFVALIGGESMGGWVGLSIMGAAHAAALLLVGRALVPATGRRTGAALATGLVCWLLFNVMLAVSWVAPRHLAGKGLDEWLFGAACVMLAALLLLMPRPIRTPPPLQGRMFAALALVLVLAGAAALVLRDRTPFQDTPADRTLRVAVIDAQHGFDGQLRHDPAAVAEFVMEAAADVTVIHGAGVLPTAYGVDLAEYIGRRLGLAVFLAPSANGLSGDAILTRVRAAAVEPAAGVSASDRPLAIDRRVAWPGQEAPGRSQRSVARLLVPVGNDTLLIVAVPGSSADAQMDRLEAMFGDPTGGPHVIVVGNNVHGRGVDMERRTPAGAGIAPFRSTVVDLILR